MQLPEGARTMAGSSFSYGHSVEFYDYIVPYGARKDVEFYVSLAGETPGNVLELGCGTGRILIPVARSGVRITGLDAEPGMLELCREKLSGEPEQVRGNVTLVEGDMRDFDLGTEFGLITVPFRAFQHLETVEDQISCLGRVREHLSDEGTFVLDLFNPSMASLLDENRKEEFGDEPEFSMPDGRLVTRRARVASVDRVRQVMDCEFIYYVTHPDGRNERLVHPFTVRYLFRYEAEHLLCRCGFRIREVFGGFDRSPFGSDWPGEQIFLAERA
jgi:SAM-dependent methyltransferase